MDPTAAAPEIARQIQLSVAPVFLLAGVGAILNVLAHRLARVVDRARTLAEAAESLDEAERALAALELRFLTRRITAANVAIACCTASALLVCIVVATLFVAAPTQLAVGRLISWLFIAAMAMLTAGLILFLHEIQLAMRSLRIRFPRGGSP
jgi:hypothetical protein